jgi:hypothetical protein
MTEISTIDLANVTGGAARAKPLKKVKVGPGVSILTPKFNKKDPWVNEPMFGQ